MRIISILLVLLFVTGFSYAQQQCEIHLNEGTNWISINVMPDDSMWQDINQPGPDVPRMFAQYREHIISVRDNNGFMYLPASNDFNSFPYWNLENGLTVNAGESFDAVWEGEPIPSDRLIILKEENFSPYYPGYQLDAGPESFYVISSIIDIVEYVSDVDGNFMLPQIGYSNMPPWSPGQAYYVRLNLEENEEIQFHYPPEQEGDPYIPWRGDHWDINSSSSLIITEIGGIDYENGDQVGIFHNEDQLAAGDVQINGMCALAIPLDSSLVNYNFVYWDESEQSEINLSVASEEINGSYRLVVFSRSESVDDIMYNPREFSLNSPFPNPFNSSTRISYSIPEHVEVNINVFNINGQLVTNLFKGKQNAGEYGLTWECSGQPSGLYIIKVNAGRRSQVRKVILSK